MTKFRYKTVSPSTIDKATAPIYHKYYDLLADKYGNMPDDWEGWRIDAYIDTLAEDNHGRVYLEDFENLVGDCVDCWEKELGVEGARPMREVYESVIDYFRIK